MPLLAIPTFAILVQRRSIEEETLVACFGEEYQQYAQRTGRFLPRLA
jgi:protein-S-isoprenylcysteine O-methyltransferase Ste14